VRALEEGRSPILLFEPAGSYYDYRWTGVLATMLESKVEMLAMSAPADEHRLAIHRAAMTVIVEAMDRVDDSGAEMS
jgi:hypothetical protein